MTMMTVEKITLLSVSEYGKYKSLIPKFNSLRWWLKTPSEAKGVYCVNGLGELQSFRVWDARPYVRPVCVFSFDTYDTQFWLKKDALIGSEIKVNHYAFTVLDVKNGRVTAICNAIMNGCRFDLDTAIWDNSELKAWLETEGLKRITT
jgi:hypothetical protein